MKMILIKDYVEPFFFCKTELKYPNLSLQQFFNSWGSNTEFSA